MIGFKGKYSILLVEDSEGDILLTTEALEETGLCFSLDVLKNGEDAISRLQEANSLPHLILLDINLPKIGGLEVLKFIKSNDLLRSIPVVMLTTSNNEVDINISYENYCNYYIQKPTELEFFFDAIEVMVNQWFRFSCLPKSNKG